MNEATNDLWVLCWCNGIVQLYLLNIVSDFLPDSIFSWSVVPGKVSFDLLYNKVNYNPVTVFDEKCTYCVQSLTLPKVSLGCLGIYSALNNQSGLSRYPGSGSPQ